MAQVRQGGLDRAPVRKDPGRRSAFGSVRPALGLAGPAEQREDQCAMDRDRRVVVGGSPVAQRLDPLHHGLHAATGPRRRCQLENEACLSVVVAGLFCVRDRDLGQAVRLIPLGRPAVQVRDQVGVAPL
jgi:hypothetical protein